LVRFGPAEGATAASPSPAATPPLPSPSPIRTLPPPVPFPSVTPKSPTPAPPASPVNPAVAQYASKGIAQYSAGDMDGAIASFTAALQVAPGMALLYLNRANAYLYKPNFPAAIADANKALELKVEKTDDAYTIRGTARAGLGDYNSAIADCNRALRLNPKNALAYNNRANNKIRLRDYAGALADCNRSIALDPNSALPVYNRGFARINLGDQSGALADWLKAVQMQASFGAELNPKIQQLQALGVRPKQTGPVGNGPKVKRR
jgi:tetratricopeptide (TPR) repeat protein